MKSQKLSSSERSQLRKEQRISLLLGIGMLTVITTINLLFHFKDVVMGMDVIERPPVSQLIIIQAIGIVLSIAIYYFSAKKVIQDLLLGVKRIEQTQLNKRYFKRINGELTFFFLLKNGIETDVDKTTYGQIHEGENVIAHFSPNTKTVYALIHADAKQSH